MTTYTTITNALVAVGAKPFATTIQALRDNPIAIAEADATVPAGLLPTVLLGTLTTTSGNAQTLSGLTLTPYKFLLLVLNSVSSTATSTLFITTATVGREITASNAQTASLFGSVLVDLSTGVFTATTGGTSTVAFTGGGASGLSKASTSVTVINSGVTTFDAGSIRVYGIK